MNKLNIILSIIIFILFFIIYLFIPSNNTLCTNYKLYKKILLNNVINDIKPGDLLLFSSNKYNIITRTFGNSTFSHIAIVIKIDNKLLGNERFCSEYISEILHNINISSIPYNSKKIKLQTAIINLCNNTIYKNPVQIIHENLLINNINLNYNTLNYC